MLISVAGKGGTGKSTISALLVDYLVKDKKGTVLAVDADPNSNLDTMLGIKSLKSIVELVDDVSCGKSGIPTGVAKKDFFEYKLHESITESDGFDLLAMGRPEGPGCYCYVNDLLREIIGKLSKSYDHTIIDNEAGMEHLSRRTARKADIFFIISDNTPIGIRCAKRIYELIQGLKLSYKNIYLILNMVHNGIEDILPYIKESGIELAGYIPQSKNIYNLSLDAKPMANTSDRNVLDAIRAICQKAGV